MDQVYRMDGCTNGLVAVWGDTNEWMVGGEKTDGKFGLTGWMDSMVVWVSG